MAKKAYSVLIIDDDSVFLQTVRGILELNGYEVHDAGTAEAGFEAVVETKPDLVLLDINLPDKSGFDVLDAIKSSETFSKLPVFLITGDTALDVDAAFDNGADDCLFKPINVDDILYRIKKTLK